MGYPEQPGDDAEAHLRVTQEYLALVKAAKAVVDVPRHVWKYGALSRGRWEEVQTLLDALAALVKGGGDG